MSQKRSRREYEADLRKQQSPFVLYGTALPPLDENTRDDGSYVPVWKQEVTDDRGRKRLHGAFTGGYSAGYFNTVGSKEGWAPSTFVSSRANRDKDGQTTKQQTVEDFMDEEDLQEQEEQRQISTNEGFAGFGTADDAAVRNVLDDLFKPAEDTMGEKLLNKMGWKKGQGIGPRVRRKVDPKNEQSEIREFPPEDSPMLGINQKSDTKGLGFGAEEGSSNLRPETSRHAIKREGSEDDDNRPGLSFMNRPKTKDKQPKRGGIGVGSLNDTGSDDEDPYEMGPKMSYNRVIGGDKKKEKKSKILPTTTANPLLKTKPVYISKSKQLPSILTSLRKCHDGKLPLTGFVLSDGLDTFSAMSLSDDKYKPPEVPEDWQPIKTTHVDPLTQPPSTTPTPNLTQSTADSRRAALGEPSLPSKSVFDFLSPAARDRLVTSTGNQNLPPGLNERPESQSTTANAQDPTATTNFHTRIAPIDPPTALTALTRLRKDKAPPYADDLPKQGRYKDFLRYSSDPQPIAQRVPPLRAPQHRFRDEEHFAELAEFAATAELFRPATGFLASRFMSAAEGSAGSKNKGNEDGADGGADTDELLTGPTPKPKDPAEEAARMGMFGVATRSVVSWQPTRLVCKRFGVEMPVVE